MLQSGVPVYMEAFAMQVRCEKVAKAIHEVGCGQALGSLGAELHGESCCLHLARLRDRLASEIPNYCEEGSECNPRRHLAATGNRLSVNRA